MKHKKDEYIIAYSDPDTAQPTVAQPIHIVINHYWQEKVDPESVENLKVKEVTR